jgi:hypothetical protein
MLMDGDDLRRSLLQTETAIELRNEHGRCCRLLSREDALALDLDLFVGIGNRRRVRFLRFRTQRSLINAGSRSTQRLSNSSGTHIAHPLIREHRPLWRTQ